MAVVTVTNMLNPVVYKSHKATNEMHSQYSLLTEKNDCMGQMIKDHSKNKNKIIIIKNKDNKARRKEMFYLTMHSTHFIYGYME